MMRLFFFFAFAIFVLIGCQEEQSSENAEVEVTFYVVNEDQIPLGDAAISLVRPSKGEKE
ncbi:MULTISPECIES: hypothetical protein [Virgibacillus]|uniref:Uncharacterized protein n=2 Tax=Virgibacillus massiliensis TaxID=1462526 RepID=A0A024QEF4_9BACI|nr:MULTISPECIES: hypothetical protein [Virgibacillus]CDQ40879.1 hypothetical protein BN990_03212 [Virgibacillus massiliensis]